MNVLAISPSAKMAFVGVGNMLLAFPVDPLVGRFGDAVAEITSSAVRSSRPPRPIGSTRTLLTGPRRAGGLVDSGRSRRCAQGCWAPSRLQRRWTTMARSRW